MFISRIVLTPAVGETEPTQYTLPGEGQAKVVEILRALKDDDYNGGPCH
jgi:sugar phosphate isomerase/epimerase